MLTTWRNENSLTPYPLSKSIGFDTLLVDANFVQFDGFVPILKSISSTNTDLIITIEFDKQTEIFTISKSLFTGEVLAYRLKPDTRYFGLLVFGTEAATISDTITGQTFEFDVPFLPHLVKSIPSTAGVFSLGGATNEVTLVAADPPYVTFSVDDQTVTFNAVALPEVVNSAYLKTLNGVTPVYHNIDIVDSALVKVDIAGVSTVKLSLIGA